MSTSKFITGKGAAVSAIPSMEEDLSMPDLDKLETVADDDTATNTDDSFDTSDYALYM